MGKGKYNSGNANVGVLRKVYKRKGMYKLTTIIHYTMYSVQCTVYSRPVRTNFFFAILKTFTSVTIMYAMMNKCLKF